MYEMPFLPDKIPPIHRDHLAFQFGYNPAGLS